MGKKRVAQLLEQLEANQNLELQNAAAIFTVAQVAVNELKEQTTQEPISTVAALPPAPALLDKAELIRRYGSHVNCRKAAKALGIKFPKTPTWEQLIAALSYIDTFQTLIQSYIAAHPNAHLHRVTIALKID